MSMVKRDLQTAAILLVLATAMLTSFMFAGCYKYEPVQEISLHLYADIELEGSQGKMIIRDPQTEQTRAVRKIPFLTSHFILKAESKFDEKTGKYGLVLHLDKFAKRVLLHLEGQAPSDPFAIIIDGFFVGTGFLPKRTDDIMELELPPLWTKGQAERLVKHAELNYSHYHDRHWW